LFSKIKLISGAEKLTNMPESHTSYLMRGDSILATSSCMLLEVQGA